MAYTIHLHLSKARVTALNMHARGIICVFVSLVNPRRMREGYGSRCVCVCVCVCLSVCLSVTALAATYLVCMSKLRHHRVPCRLLKVFIAWISLKIFCSGDTA